MTDPSPLLVEIAGLLPPGRALDLACGTGRHTLHLARLGWQVTAVDIAPDAIRELRAAAEPNLAIDTIVADLEKHEFTIEPNAYDLICDFHYLQRDLFPQIREGIRPDGSVIGPPMPIEFYRHISDDDLKPIDPRVYGADVMGLHR